MKFIPGYENLYYATEEGEVYNCRTKTLVRNKRTGTRKSYTVSLRKDGKITDLSLPRLIASLFVSNPDPENYTIVEHIDGDYNNNRADNLRWKKKRKRSSGNPVKKIPVICVETGERWESVSQAAVDKGLNSGALWSACTGKCGGFHWKIDTSPREE